VDFLLKSAIFVHRLFAHSGADLMRRHVRSRRKQTNDR